MIRSLRTHEALVTTHSGFTIAIPTAIMLLSLAVLMVAGPPQRDPTRLDRWLFGTALLMLPLLFVVPLATSLLLDSWLDKQGYGRCPNTAHGVVDTVTFWILPTGRCPT